MAPAMMKKSIGQGTVADVLEGCRKAIVGTARNGNTCVLFTDKLTPDFINEYTGDEKNFPSNIVFDKDAWANQENYIKVVREDENHSIGGLNPGMYTMQPGFNLVICSAATEENVNKFASNVPHFDQFKKFKLTNWEDYSI